MLPEQLYQLISQEEGTKLDFKKKYDLSKPLSQEKNTLWQQCINGQWDEFIKDIISLANGNTGASEHWGRLIIGVGDSLSNNGSRPIFDTSDIKLSRQQILDKVNSSCSPSLPDLVLQEVRLEGMLLKIIGIPPTPYLHETTRQLVTAHGEFSGSGQLKFVKQGTVYSAFTTFIRRGESVYPASREERQALEQEKSLVVFAKEHNILIRLLTFLEDKRVLYSEFEDEYLIFANKSVLSIRERLTSDLEDLHHTSELAFSLNTLRSACVNFLESIADLDPRSFPVRVYHGRHGRENGREDIKFYSALTELRVLFCNHISHLILLHGVQASYGTSRIIRSADFSIEQVQDMLKRWKAWKLAQNVS